MLTSMKAIVNSDLHFQTVWPLQLPQVEAQYLFDQFFQCPFFLQFFLYWAQLPTMSLHSPVGKNDNMKKYNTDSNKIHNTKSQIFLNLYRIGCRKIETSIGWHFLSWKRAIMSQIKDYQCIYYSTFTKNTFTKCPFMLLYILDLLNFYLCLVSQHDCVK